jgi:hypothetical protein
MEDHAMAAKRTLWEAFGQVPDPRSSSGRRYPLQAILTLTSVAMLSGAYTPSPIRLWRITQVRFKNKLYQAAESARDCLMALVQWASAMADCKRLGKELWIVTDGGFTKAEFLKFAISTGATIVTRLRKDAALHALVNPAKNRKPGRPQVWSANKSVQ